MEGEALCEWRATKTTLFQRNSSFQKKKIAKKYLASFENYVTRGVELLRITRGGKKRTTAVLKQLEVGNNCAARNVVCERILTSYAPGHAHDTLRGR